MQKDSRILVTGGHGMVGSALVRALHDKGYDNIYFDYPHKYFNLCKKQVVTRIFEEVEPEYVFHTAAIVGGIQYNIIYPEKLLIDNIQIATNVLGACANKAKRVVNIGSSCIYPKYARQPIKEEYLYTGLLEPSNQPFALSKLVAIELCNIYHKNSTTDFVTTMLPNLYGPFDNFSLVSSHVIPALIRKFYEAVVRKCNEVVVWGSKDTVREFLHVDDLSYMLINIMNDESIIGMINCGNNKGHTIGQVADTLKVISGFDGEIVFDDTKPIGTPVKVMQSNYYGPSRSLYQGLKDTYEWFENN